MEGCCQSTGTVLQVRGEGGECVCVCGGGGYGGFYAVSGQPTVPLSEYGIYIYR